MQILLRPLQDLIESIPALNIERAHVHLDWETEHVPEHQRKEGTNRSMTQGSNRGGDEGLIELSPRVAGTAEAAGDDAREQIARQSLTDVNVQVLP